MRARSTRNASASTGSPNSPSSTAMRGRWSSIVCATTRRRPRRRPPSAATASCRSSTGSTRCGGGFRPPEFHPPRIRRVRQFGSFDYVIVGAGSAGCLLANRLSRDPQTRVLLIEAGGRDNYFWIPIPVGYLYTIANPCTDWCYKTQPDEHLAGRSIHYARGRVLGGCSSINAMIYMRGQKEDYDHWASLGNAGWSWDEVLPLFRKVEDYQHGADEMHGVGGELRVEESRVRWQILEAWRDAAEECGIPKIKEFNRGNNFGSAYFQMNQKRGVRWSATKAFLRPALPRPNLTVMTHALVERLRIEVTDGVRRAGGVAFAHPREGRCLAQAARETILAA